MKTKIRFNQHLWDLLEGLPWKQIFIMVFLQMLIASNWLHNHAEGLPPLYWDSAAYFYQDIKSFHALNLNGWTGFLKSALEDGNGPGHPLLFVPVALLFQNPYMAMLALNSIFLICYYAAVAIFSNFYRPQSAKFTVLFLGLIGPLFTFGMQVEQWHFSAMSLVFLVFALMLTDSRTQFTKVTLLAGILVSLATLIRVSQVMVLAPLLYAGLFIKFLQNREKEINWKKRIIPILSFSFIILALSGWYVALSLLDNIRYYRPYLSHIKNHMGLEGASWLLYYPKHLLEESIGWWLGGVLLVALVFLIVFRVKPFQKKPWEVSLWSAQILLFSAVETRTPFCNIGVAFLPALLLGVSVQSLLDRFRPRFAYLSKAVVCFFILLVSIRWIGFGTHIYKNEIDGRDWSVHRVVNTILNDLPKHNLERQASVLVLASDEVYSTVAIDTELMIQHFGIFSKSRLLDLSTHVDDASIWSHVREADYVITKSSKLAPPFLEKHAQAYQKAAERIQTEKQLSLLYQSDSLPDGSTVSVYFQGRRCYLLGLTSDGWLSQEGTLRCFGKGDSNREQLELTGNLPFNSSEVPVIIEVWNQLKTEKLGVMTLSGVGEFQQKVSFPTHSTSDLRTYRLVATQTRRVSKKDPRPLAIYQPKFQLSF